MVNEEGDSRVIRNLGATIGLLVFVGLALAVFSNALGGAIG